MAGITPDTLDTYKRDGRAPKPDGYLGRSPWWWESTISRWLRTRRTKPGNLSKVGGAAAQRPRQGSA
jgi:hypothetical protein